MPENLKTKSAAESVANWTRGLQSVPSSDMEKAVNNSDDWAGNLKASKEIIKARVIEAIDKKFDKNVDATGTSGWRKGMIEKGIGTMKARVGTDSAKSAMSQGLSKVLSVISSTSVPTYAEVANLPPTERLKARAAFIDELERRKREGTL